jgi:hypothetical protein
VLESISRQAPLPSVPQRPRTPPDGFTHGAMVCVCKCVCVCVYLTTYLAPSYYHVSLYTAIQVFEDGTQYTGEWVGGWRHGRGSCTWPDGREYAGQVGTVLILLLILLALLVAKCRC